MKKMMTALAVALGACVMTVAAHSAANADDPVTAPYPTGDPTVAVTTITEPAPAPHPTPSPIVIPAPVVAPPATSTFRMAVKPSQKSAVAGERAVIQQKQASRWVAFGKKKVAKDGSVTVTLSKGHTYTLRLFVPAGHGHPAITSQTFRLTAH